jgi:flagellar biogenesis protein FliO
LSSPEPPQPASTDKASAPQHSMASNFFAFIVFFLLFSWYFFRRGDARQRAAALIQHIANTA